MLPLPPPPTRAKATLARIVAPTPVRARPGAAPVIARLDPQERWTGGPVRLLVLGARRRDGTTWLRVRLPERPNTAAGWIDGDRARLSTTPFRIVVRVRTRTVTVLRAGHRVQRFRAVVGKPSTPTPTGLFAIAAKSRQPDPGAFLGPWALHLTAHSTVLDDYGGGRGRVAIHGRSGASLLDALGTARSHGCVRIDNRRVDWLAKHLPVGTPVRIHR